MTVLKAENSEASSYRAFISYSHQDKAIATWLHSTLERYRLPKKLVGKTTRLGIVPSRLAPIFRDQDELPASGNLSTELEGALSQSMFLIVVCSPSSACSKWVNEEIRQFKALHGAQRVLALIVGGEPNVKAQAADQECFPPALKFVVTPDGQLTNELSEPIAADIRKYADGKRLAILKLVSGLTALRLDDLVQRETARRMRTLVQISAASFVAAVFAVGLALYANDRRIDANTQRDIAEQEAENARAVSDFLVESFSSAKSLQENPNAVTARSILDSGAKRIGTELKQQPFVQSRLSATIAVAFNNLGLFDDAIRIVDSTAAISGVEFAPAILHKADALLKKGDLDAALETAQHAKDLTAQESSQGWAINTARIRANIAVIIGQIHYFRGQHDDGIKAFDQALVEFEKIQKLDPMQIARVLQSRALLLSDMGNMNAANADLEKAMQIAVEGSGGEKDVIIAEISLAQAQVSFLSWNLEPALIQINAALDNMRLIRDEDNPSIADALSMKGQILQGLGQLEQAHEVLTQAVNTYTQAYKGRHYLSGIAEVYLGLIAGDQKELDAALSHFTEAKLHYDESYGEIHANHGDLLVNQASVLAANGEVERAKKDCEEGMVILNDTLGPDAAFTQQLQAVCDDIYLQ